MSYTYDAAGNLTNDGVHTYQYDAENRLMTKFDQLGQDLSDYFHTSGVAVPDDVTQMAKSIVGAAAKADKLNLDLSNNDCWRRFSSQDDLQRIANIQRDQDLVPYFAAFFGHFASPPDPTQLADDD